MVNTPWDTFRRMVLSDPALQGQLQAAPDLPTLSAMTVRLAAERGLDLPPEALETAIREGRKAWMERHL